MFEKQDFAEIAGKCDFLQKHVGTLVNKDQLKKIAEAFAADLDSRKDDFIKTKEKDIAEMRLTLQMMFTKIIIKRIKIKLIKNKRKIQADLGELVNLDKERHEL